MVTSGDTLKKVGEITKELQRHLDDLRATQQGAADSEAILSHLYKLKTKAGEAVEIVKGQEGPAVPKAAPYKAKINRLYQRL